MKRWSVQIEDKVKDFTEEDLRKRLRKRKLTGVELCRFEGEESWRPLHDTELFRQEVPFSGDPGQEARKRAIAEFGWHAGAFLGVMG